MRKKRLKKMYPNRHRIIELLREGDNHYQVVDSNGNEVVLNLKKHLLYGNPYKNKEYQNELDRRRKELN